MLTCINAVRTSAYSVRYIRAAAIVRHASSKGGSSSRYIARQKRDPYVRAARKHGETGDGVAYVSRAAFKLKQLDDAYRILGKGKVVVDLGAAPGGWTQVALESRCSHVFAIDLLPLSSVIHAERLTVLRGDFCDATVQQALNASIEEKVARPNDEVQAGVDVIISDMMGNTTGNRLRDISISLDLLHAALSFARRVLRVADSPNCTSTLVMKYFDSDEAQQFKSEHLLPNFNKVTSKKVAASRSESSEMYFICSDMKTTARLA